MVLYLRRLGQCRNWDPDFQILDVVFQQPRNRCAAPAVAKSQGLKIWLTSGMASG